MKKDFVFTIMVLIFTSVFTILAPTYFVNYSNGLKELYFTHFYQFILYLSPTIFCLFLGFIFKKRINSDDFFRQRFFAVYDLVLLSVLLSSFISGILRPEVYKSALWYIFEYIGTILSILSVYFIGAMTLYKSRGRK